MKTATLRVTPQELAYINRIIKKDFSEMKEGPYKEAVKVVLQKIQDAIISF